MKQVLKESHLEFHFRRMYKILAPKIQEPVTEYRFLDERRFRFDFAWPDKKVAVEIEGGLYGKGRHTTVTGFNADCEKYNLAVMNGWKVLRFTEKMLANDIEFCIVQVVELLLKKL